MDINLIEKARKLVSEGKVVYSGDAEKDILLHNYSKTFLQESFNNGILITKNELYLDTSKLISKTSPFYCLHSYTHSFLSILGKRYILIGWDFAENKEEIIIFIHTSPCTGYEIKRYKELK
ncbi:MAG: hypothetical protein PHD81_02035 [Candidatus Nanoarchaeia archaeon]|nr:hypothetical protein [Candidatus Nanoarchaeia archaeon]MDD5587869.1 hypothetical protein [Candidatus Nanoarchaeia archaeon]